MTTKPESDRKRSPATLEPETVALRARRDVRKLDEALAALKSAYEAKAKEKTDERTKLIASLSPEARAIFNTLSGGKPEAAKGA